MGARGLTVQATGGAFSTTSTRASGFQRVAVDPRRAGAGWPGQPGAEQLGRARADAEQGGRDGDRGQEQTRGQEGRQGIPQPARGGVRGRRRAPRPQQRCPEARDRRDQQHHPLGAERLQQEHHRHRAGGRAEQVAAVDRGGARGEPLEQRADGEARRGQREQQGEVVAEEAQPRTGAVGELRRIERQAPDQRDRGHGEPGERQRVLRRAARRRLGRARDELQHDAAHRHAEQRDADHHEGEVVPDREREEAQEDDLEREDRAREERDRGTNRGVGGAHGGEDSENGAPASG